MARLYWLISRSYINQWAVCYIYEAMLSIRIILWDIVFVLTQYSYLIFTLCKLSCNGGTPLHLSGFRQKSRCIRAIPKENKYIIEISLYELHESGREWNTWVNRWFVENGFTKFQTKHCIYFHYRDSEFATVLLDVDDIMCTTTTQSFIGKCSSTLTRSTDQKIKGYWARICG